MSEQFELTVEQTSLLIFDWDGTLAKCDGNLIVDVKETLQQLRAAGFTLAIATSMSTNRLMDLLTENDVTDLFSHEQTSEMGFPKPDPKMLDAILLSTATEPEHALMIGDSSFDIQMATDARIKAIGVLTGCDTAEQFQSVQPLLILDSVNDLLNYLVK
jgi:phosphoglycolate phosphatase